MAEKETMDMKVMCRSLLDKKNTVNSNWRCTS